MAPNRYLSADTIAALSEWAENGEHHPISRLWVFGSRAKGDSDLDLAVEFQKPIDSELAELIENLSGWRDRLTALTGVKVKDIHLANDSQDIAYQAVRLHGVLVYTRQRDPRKWRARKLNISALPDASLLDCVHFAFQATKLSGSRAVSFGHECRRPEKNDRTPILIESLDDFSSWTPAAIAARENNRPPAQ